LNELIEDEVWLLHLFLTKNSCVRNKYYSIISCVCNYFFGGNIWNI
jgi:hypothetical protein